MNLEFFKKVDPENSHYTTSGNSIYFVIRKAEAEEEFWPRITKEKLKYHYIKTDFDKWVDEDEQEEKPLDDDLAGMQGMGGAGGMPGGPGGMGDMDLSQLMGGAGGAGGAPDFSQLASMMGGAGGADGAGGFDFSKLAQGAGPVDPQTTEGDFSSSDEDEEKIEQVN